MNKINSLITQYSDIIRMMEAYRDGEEVQWKGDVLGLWYDVNESCEWLACFEYRIKPKEPPITVPWDYLSEDVVALAMSPSGSIYAYTKEPTIMGHYGWISSEPIFTTRLVKGIVSNIPKERWKESLTLRP